MQCAYLVKIKANRELQLDLRATKHELFLRSLQRCYIVFTLVRVYRRLTVVERHRVLQCAMGVAT